MRPLVLLTLVLTAHAQEIPGIYGPPGFLTTTASTDESALGAWFNPAVAGADDRFDLRYLWSPGPEGAGQARWGLFTSTDWISYGVTGVEAGPRDHHMSIAIDDGGFGFGYGWSTGKGADDSRQSYFSLGTVQRPNDYLSLGIAGRIGRGNDAQLGIFDLGVRPFGDPRLLFFADAELRTESDDELAWGVGAAIEPFAGIRLSGKYLESSDYSVGLSIHLGTTGLLGHLLTSESSGGATTSIPTYGVRWGDSHGGLFDRLAHDGDEYVSLELHDRVAYRRFKILDDAPTLTSTLIELDRAIDDPKIGGVVLSLAGVGLSHEIAWELRQKLAEVRAAKKKVVVFVENGGMVEYHLASVADHIVLDPVGGLFLPGEALSKTYLKGTLEKLGLGFDELRFFTYKSAAETFSRDRFSEADREQLQVLNDGFYDLIRDDVGASRGVDAATFDGWIDRTIFLPEQALEAGLVDEIARWHEVDEVIESFAGDETELVKSGELAGREPVDRDWSNDPTIAIVYALGLCAMDSGIKARQLEELIGEIADDESVAAVILRADSPGGSALASDLVADALRICAENKPVIVSMGSVAASGGYWISMYGGQIFAAPNSITGSIGVIAGWIWNKELGEHLGMTSDHVQKGEHADLGAGLALPLLGVRIPNRPLRPTERARIERAIRALYDDFVAKVAEGRGMEAQAVDEVGQGRVWLGEDAVERGLVDRIGGLWAAIEAARSAAGIDPEEGIRILELPEMGLFDPDLLRPWPAGVRLRSSPELSYIVTITENPHAPLVMLPPALVPLDP